MEHDRVVLGVSAAGTVPGIDASAGRRGPLHETANKSRATPSALTGAT
jgi:hypothetical protein